RSSLRSPRICRRQRRRAGPHGRPHALRNSVGAPWAPYSTLDRVTPSRTMGRASENPAGRSARSWHAVLKRTVREFREDNLTDWAAALTYYGVMSLFPMVLVLVALLGLVGQQSTIATMTDSLRSAGLGDVAKNVQGPLDEIVRNKGGAGALLGFGL